MRRCARPRRAPSRASRSPAKRCASTASRVSEYGTPTSDSANNAGAPSVISWGKTRLQGLAAGARRRARGRSLALVESAGPIRSAKPSYRSSTSSRIVMGARLIPRPRHLPQAPARAGRSKKRSTPRARRPSAEIIDEIASQGKGLARIRPSIARIRPAPTREVESRPWTRRFLVPSCSRLPCSLRIGARARGAKVEGAW